MPETTRPNGCPPGQGQIVPEHGGRIGNPPFEPTDQQRSDVRTWAKIASHETIAAMLGITTRTLAKYFPDELAEGKFEAVAAVGGKLLAKALKGDTASMIFYLKTQGKWSTRIEHTGPDGGPIQTVDISSALDGMSEAQLAAIEPIIESLIAAGGGDFDFRAIVGSATGEGEAG
jgi:hypothetical protein